jgi:DNA modification methylase
MDIKFERHWCMPSHKTFTIKPFKNLIAAELGSNYVDPFPYPFVKDAIDYLKTIPDNSVNHLVFDPPYSQRQLKEKYHSAGLSFNHPMNNSYWSNCRKEISRIVKSTGKVISFGWNTNGIGIKHGFKITKVVLVAHGSQHNDTIATVEVKI